MIERASVWACAAVLGSALAGCGPDTVDVAVSADPTPPGPTDDAAPPPTPYDASLTFTDRRGLQANHSTDRFRLDVAAFRDDAERSDAGVLYPSHGAFMAAHPDALPSIQTVVTYEKALDDAIYAGVELAEQRGLAPTLAPKTEVLAGALDWLAAHRSAAADEAIALVAAGLEEGGARPDVPPDLEGAVAGVRARFAADPARSKPIGFYTWSADLEAIWRQDRLLQGSLPSAGSACALAAAIAADAGRKARYLELLALYSRLTNPLEASLADLLPLAGGASCEAAAAASEHAFLGASRTPEVELFRRLYPNGVPAGADLMQGLVNAIRAGTLDLAPKPADGFYAQQLFALETLLVTDRAEERAKVAFMARYKKRLQEAFETLLVQHRETHAKQTGDTLTSNDVTPTPDFRVEPLATVFVRHARSYVFLEAALGAVLGDRVLDDARTEDAGGATQVSLRAQIRANRDLFYGLYLIACQDLGMRPALGAVGDPDPAALPALAAAADAWLLGLGADPAAKADVRVMIPIATIDESHVRYWAVIGVRETLAGYSFIDGMDVSPPPAERQRRVPLPTEAFLEVTSSAVPLGRDELRALCDAQRTPEAIRAALEAR
jgi:hypothetical protein